MTKTALKWIVSLPLIYVGFFLWVIGVVISKDMDFTEKLLIAIDDFTHQYNSEHGNDSPY
jgi:hypothetical protein